MEIRSFEVTPVAHREPPLRNSWGAHSELAARTIVRIETADDVIRDPPLEISDGAIDVPDDPGLGVELDEDRVAEMHEVW